MALQMTQSRQWQIHLHHKPRPLLQMTETTSPPPLSATPSDDLRQRQVYLHHRKGEHHLRALLKSDEVRRAPSSPRAEAPPQHFIRGDFVPFGLICFGMAVSPLNGSTPGGQARGRRSG